MLKDNQLSTILLLGVIGFLIYFLTKPKCVSEKFNETNPLNQINQINPTKSTKSTKSTKPMKPKNVKSRYEHFADDLDNYDLPIDDLDINDLDINDLDINDLDINDLPIDDLPIDDLPIEKLPVIDLPIDDLSMNISKDKNIINGNLNDIFQYEPNDIQESGASLDDAFTCNPSQKNCDDVINFNKNNVKNYDVKDFLPKEINNQWFDTDFSQAKFNINDDKLINTERYVIGINTVGQSLKNASYDIRGTIANPKFTVSPWNNSTYEPDFNLRPLC
jgi:hypothetical protein